MPDDEGPPLGYFEGKPVLSASLAMRKAGDGLSQSMSIEPRAYQEGDVVYVVLECVVGPIQFKPLAKVRGFDRKHDFLAGTATIVDRDLVIGQLDEQRRRNEEAAQAAAEAKAAEKEAAAAAKERREVEGQLELDPTRDPDVDPLGAFAVCLCSHTKGEHPADNDGECVIPECPCGLFKLDDEAAAGG